MGHARTYDPTPIWGLAVNYHRMWHTFLLPNIIKQAGMTYCIAAPLKAPVYVTRLSTFWVSNPMMVGGMIVSRGNTIWGILKDKVKPSDITARQSGEKEPWFTAEVTIMPLSWLYIITFLAWWWIIMFSLKAYVLTSLYVSYTIMILWYYDYIDI